jgi:transcription-repair coupling factor (superfamily II helicase)
VISSPLIDLYKEHSCIKRLSKAVSNEKSGKFRMKGLIGAQDVIIAAKAIKEIKKSHLFILNDKEEAAYFINDLELILKEEVLFYPSSYRRPYQIEETDNANILLRIETLNKINRQKQSIIISYPEAIFEKVINQKQLSKNSLDIQKGDELSIRFVNECLQEYNFEKVEFVVEPGQYSVRGGIIDIFSFSNENPYRIEFFDEEIESIRTFDINSQRSKEQLSKASIVPNVQILFVNEDQQSIFEFLHKETIVWIKDSQESKDKLNDFYEKAINEFKKLEDRPLKHIEPDQLFLKGEDLITQLQNKTVIEFGNRFYFDSNNNYEFKSTQQPVFNKQFNLLIEDLKKSSENGFQNFILCSSNEQVKRLEQIVEDSGEEINFKSILFSLNKGFIDHQLKICCYTDHQIFERYHKFKLKTGFANKQSITIKQLSNLQPGDYVTHIDHGIGKFAGLHTIDISGKKQEAIKLLYKDNDTLFISIHSLHKIAKYSGKEGSAPKTNKLGSGHWQKTKTKTKTRVKTIAYDLIKLYAKRKEQVGFEFSPDSFLQHELEASFMFEDTPDQLKTTIAVKQDMENTIPMDRLVCGDVGFGKTEIAIRAAFKAVADNKQVAVLVPTTILAMQHAKSFAKRLEGLPCNVDYINRFRTAKEQKETLKKVESGEVDILIGTHRIVGKDVKFKDIGLLVIDEEQKFGVSIKDKLKTLKSNIDTLTLTATPIPRTLQFSLMGARDLSVINTAPPNRHPVETLVTTFDEEIIRDAVRFEISRGGQIYFVHNRIENIKEVAGLLQRLCPDARIRIGHGQMEGKKLESLMLDFMDNQFDVLVSTTIIESGLDIPNANTIIINNANNFGLSDLHQMRGRVGRSNKKSFCYLLAPPTYSLTLDAKKRLNALEQFSALGSGFNISMRDLDIRGAGDLLGAEQSGFISDIGFEMYQKILDEALAELKDEEFKELYKDEQKDNDFVKECQIDTDLQILIPDDYISSISERLSLYKELTSLEKEVDLKEFEANIVDRFGPIPNEVYELISSIRLRWIGKELGFQRISLKNNLFTGYFVSQENTDYFQSNKFGQILQFFKSNFKTCEMKELKGKSIFRVTEIGSIEEAMNKCKEILEVKLN